MSNDYEKSLDLAARNTILSALEYMTRTKKPAQYRSVARSRCRNPAIAWLDTTRRFSCTPTGINAFRQQSEKCKNAFARCGADLLQLSTEQAYIPILTALFRKRK
ncbi:MAG: hypothetical protein IPL33_21145 [Sphingobacteriales bacterium]|nr:hypothetical protein [Sphingobacteriales bacterium]